jgi:dTDP-4-amino-4,6-dideoxygalactose transaminase
MQFIDLASQQKRIKKKIDERIQQVLSHGQYVMGPEMYELERVLADFTGVGYAMSCSSGTDALLIALMAFGVGPGCAVFTTPYTFIATAEVVSLLGAIPVFVDIRRDTFNMDPEKLEKCVEDFQKKSVGIIPKAVITVDLFGLPSHYDEISAVAKKYGLMVLEDAAQSFGAKYRGKRAGSLADAACTSFFPAKPLGGYGDGGMCFTNDAELNRIMESVRNHGQGGDRYEHVRIGINGRLDTLQAAVLLCKFEIFAEEIQMRQLAAKRYSELLSDTPLQTPVVPDGSQSVWAQYSILAEDARQKDAIRENLQKQGVPTAVYYPKPLHLQTAFEPLGYRPGDFPVSEDCSGRIFSLPMHPYLLAKDQETIVDIIKRALIT